MLETKRRKPNGGHSATFTKPNDETNKNKDSAFRHEASLLYKQELKPKQTKDCILCTLTKTQ